jgi:pimeloyl-ACP methyl ester carboxylesterase
VRRSTIAAIALASLAATACSDQPSPLGPTSSARLAQSSASALPRTDYTIALSDVALRPGITVDLNITVFVDEDAPGSSSTPNKTALAVSGFAHTAASWSAFAEALFDNEPQRVCRLAAIDLPGHGGSGLPEGGLPFGFLTLDDYATAVLAAIEGLNARGLEVGSLIGHSQGGMVIQLAQQRLIDQETDLRDALGIKEVVLLAPTLPNGLPWAFADNGTAIGLLSGFLVPNDPVLGPHFRIPDAVWPFLFFTNLSGQLVSGVPSNVSSLNAPEPLLSALQLVGAQPFGQRPSIDAGIFSPPNGTQLTVIAFEQDVLVRPNEAAALYAYLTGQSNGQRFGVVLGAEAVHDLYVSNPTALLDGTRLVIP